MKATSLSDGASSFRTLSDIGCEQKKTLVNNLVERVLRNESAFKRTKQKETVAPLHFFSLARVKLPREEFRVAVLGARLAIFLFYFPSLPPSQTEATRRMLRHVVCRAFTGDGTRVGEAYRLRERFVVR